MLGMVLRATNSYDYVEEYSGRIINALLETESGTQILKDLNIYDEIKSEDNGENNS